MTQPDPRTTGRRAVLFSALLLAAAAPAAANQALATKHGCLGCHAATTTLVGPSYAEVAAKYGKDAAAELARSIRAGGAGKWGQMAMPPQQLSETDAKRLAAWILAGGK